MSGAPTPAAAALSGALRSFEAQWSGRAADALAAVRTQAMQRFMSLGLPTTRDETWRYTNLRPWAAKRFVDAPVLEIDPQGAASNSWLADDGAVTCLVLANGRPVFPCSGAPLDPAVRIESLRDLDRAQTEALADGWPAASDADQQRWALLNTALFQDGLRIRIDGAASTPLLVVHLGGGAGADNVAYPRVLIEAAAGSSATIIEHHLTAGGEPIFSNSATRIGLQRGATLDHYRVFSAAAGASNIDTLEIRQAEDSHCREFTLALGGGLVRTTLEAALTRAGARIDSYALLAGGDARQVDCVNIAHHGAPHTRSTQTARAIASGTSRVVFNSKVIVAAGASHSESQQSCRGLLLSPTAEIDTRPQLEIHTDEVKCAHGATTGRLDKDMFFYLLSRGLDRASAQSLLVFAFLADVLTGMSLPAARAAIENTLIAQLPDSQLLRSFR